MNRSSHNLWNWIQFVIDQIDTWVLNMLRIRATLIAAVIGTILIVWGIVTKNVDLGMEAILAGAMGYLIGFVPAVLGGLFITAIQFVTFSMGLQSMPLLFLQIMGYTYIAWLGRQHKMMAVERRMRLADVEHDPQVVSWTLINEVRNSLLAMRLLLFVRSNGSPQQNQLRMIEDELLRLESLFGKLDDTKQQNIR